MLCSFALVLCAAAGLAEASDLRVSVVQAGTPANPVVFDLPGIVVLGCNIHDTMVAWILAVNTPYFARTAADGTAARSGLPPGNYVVRAWDNSMSEEQAGEPLRVGAEALAPRRLQVDAPAVEAMH
jgi:hypothetical protein